VLEDSQANILRQIEHLAGLAALQLFGTSKIATAATATLRQVPNPLIRDSHALQMRTLVTVLAALAATRRTP
jgi:hypothetical protein